MEARTYTSRCRQIPAQSITLGPEEVGEETNYIRDPCASLIREGNKEKKHTGSADFTRDEASEGTLAAVKDTLAHQASSTRGRVGEKIHSSRTEYEHYHRRKLDSAGHHDVLDLANDDLRDSTSENTTDNFLTSRVGMEAQDDDDDDASKSLHPIASLCRGQDDVKSIGGMLLELQRHTETQRILPPDTRQLLTLQLFQIRRMIPLLFDR
ncbi:hypothetical protein BKA64DRAFT_648620 [Cadophora sp. MPI-SDFR-AT-0126]|nr:hypothetical protein BKA64DRAFT_648620 [Leotiomycetes sp. MPI-SDFR-AT-0126]